MQASFLMQRPLGGRFLIQPLPPREPNQECMVCGTAQLQLTVNTASMTLAHFVSKVTVMSAQLHPGQALREQCNSEVVYHNGMCPDMLSIFSCNFAV